MKILPKNYIKHSKHFKKNNQTFQEKKVAITWLFRINHLHSISRSKIILFWWNCWVFFFVVFFLFISTHLYFDQKQCSVTLIHHEPKADSGKRSRRCCCSARGTCCCSTSACSVFALTCEHERRIQSTATALLMPPVLLTNQTEKLKLNRV